MVVVPGAGLPDDIPMQRLGPLDFFPGMRSRFGGLGGTEPPPQPAYGFHTVYSGCGEGPHVFAVRFTGLEASSGQLTLSINAAPDRPGAAAYAVVTQNIPFRNLMLDDGIALIRFEATENVRYALLGYLHDDAQVDADALEIRLYRSDDLASYTDQLIRSRKTNYSSKTVRPVARLLSHEGPSLAEPVCQMCTARQLGEPVFDEWLAAMGAGDARDRKRWEWAFILQALRRYGVLAEGARGLGFGVGGEPLPAVMAALGCDVTATDAPEGHAAAAAWYGEALPAGIAALRRPDICADAVFDTRVAFEAVDMQAIPSAVAGYDFLWSCSAMEHLGSIAAGQQFVEASLDCVKPGGLAVYVTTYNLDPGPATIDAGDTVLFRRADLNRLALGLISRGHEVAQFKFDGEAGLTDGTVDVPPFATDPGLARVLGGFAVTSFGLIVRRGLNT